MRRDSVARSVGEEHSSTLALLAKDGVSRLRGAGIHLASDFFFSLVFSAAACFTLPFAKGGVGFGRETG